MVELWFTTGMQQLQLRDSDVLRYTDVMLHAAEALDFGRSAQADAKALHKRVSDFLRHKAPGEVVNPSMHILAYLVIQVVQ